MKILLLQQEGEGKGGEGLEDSATVVDVKWEMRKRYFCECGYVLACICAGMYMCMHV